MLSGVSVAVPAVYRLIATRLKRYFGMFATLSAGYGVHLARASVAIAATTIAAATIPKTLGPSGRTAGRTTLGLIGVAFSGEELLLFGCKRERFSAIGTLKGFLSVSH
jgi:hypothetical protein